ncbi:hypothetical protein WR25_11871 [Diploscapter pachys]|uniref:Major facilitator superfamily (MFS) profile domain-containing protein n=1 Tax=Diploscapter pachys TaxID=2018661 RepID=A0A2A2LNH4_9BILA|nr:hypothetical protein WR25_11871 [Diploscapter pachys]
MGIWASLGSSIAYSAILTTAQRWLPNNVGMAGGLIVGGYGCGAFLLSPLQTTFINPLNYRPNAEGYFTQDDLLESVPKVFLVMAGLFLILQIFGLIFVAAPDETISVETDSLIAETSSREDVAESSQIMKQLKSSTFILLFISLMCNAVWVQLTSGLYKAYGQHFITSDLFLSFVGSMASVFNASSRVFWGVLVDWTSYQFAMCLVCTMGAALAWLLPTVQFIANDILFLLTICLMFACVGGTYSLFPYVTHVCFGNTNFSIVYGVMQLSLSFAGLIAGLLSQFLLPHLGYNRLFLISGSFMAFSLFLTVILNFTRLARTVSAARQLNRQAQDRDNDE